MSQTKAQNYTLKSPNEVNVIEVFLGDQLTYGVKHGSTTVLMPSKIGITINDRQLGKKPRVQEAKESTVNRMIKPVIKVKSAEIKEHYNELRLDMKGNYSVVFRAFNEGVAYRLETKLPEEVRVDSEQLFFAFTDDVRGSFPITDGFYSHYEHNYDHKALSELPLADMSGLPAAIHLNNGVQVVITEADLYDYPGFYLQKGLGNTLEGTLPFLPQKTDKTSDRDAKPLGRMNYLGRTKGTRTYPWRILAISDDDKMLLENEMVYLLSTDLQLQNTDWIKPGKVAWDWYNANNIYGVDFKSGINTDTYKYYIDFAAKYGLEYIILDEGWYDIKTSNLLSPVSTIAMEELVQYAAGKNVGLILWVTWLALENQFEQALDKFQAWGVKGIKVDFMQRDDQWMVDYYERVAKAAAERQLLVDFHGSYKPAGLRRAYPNVLTREGVRGLENHKWDGEFANPNNDLIIPFTRMLAGPMDYTPGAMTNAPKSSYAPIFERPMALGTRCHQLAMYVVYESPLQMLADSPSKYLSEAECMEFLSVVPTVWDETRALAAEFGEYVVMARRNGNEWYIGAMTNWDERDLEVELSFLGAGEYIMTSYEDGVNADRYGDDYKMATRNVRAADKITIHLAPGGGWVAMIK